jgi:hypothetical protein
MVKDQKTKDARIMIKKTREPLIFRLDETNHTPHPFIVQYIVQGCFEHFEDEDKLKEHMAEKHECSDLIIRNYMEYTLSQLFHMSFHWWTDNNKKKEFLEISNYWTLKGTCIFKH